MKRLLLIDRILAVAFLLTAATGIGLHIAGHGNSHEVWHNWAVCHVLSGLAMLIAVGFHIYTHRAWYKATLLNRPGRRSRTTLSLSVVFLFEVVTGIMLLAIEGAWSDTGMLHYEIGLLLIVLSIGHILKRRRILFK